MKSLQNSAPYLLALTIIIIAPDINAQDSFQSTVGIAYSHSESKDELADENDLIDIYTLSGAYYYNSVELDNYPYAEAAFLQHIGFVEVDYEKIKTEFPSPGWDASGDGHDVSVMTVFMSDGSPFYFSIGYNQGEIKYEYDANLPFLGDFHGKTKTTGYEASLGYFVLENFLVGLRSGKTEYESSSDNTLPDTDDHVTKNGLFTKYVYAGDAGKAFTIEAEFSEEEWDDGDKFSITDLTANYFFLRNLGIGANVHSISSLGLGTGVNLTYYFTPKLSTELFYGKLTPEDSDNNDQVTYGLELISRF